jgi:hypothetical protein
VVEPEHIVGVPVIGARPGFTVTVVILLQPEAIVYVIIDVPAETPVTRPDVSPIVATEVEPLIQVPPGEVASIRLVLDPTQVVEVPVMAPIGFTVINKLVAQPLPSA